MGELLLKEVIRLAASGGTLVDVYCGAGFFAHALRNVFQKVIGIERSQGSILRAREEAHQNEEFLEGSAEELLPDLLQRLAATKSDQESVTIILDPPSEGLSELVSSAIIKHLPEKILYVSCNPATLARDVKRLSEQYELKEVTPLDMFTQTAEIESLSLLICKK